MLATPEILVARPIAGLLPLDDRREPLKVLIASLARGGAERIVLEWLAEEARRGRAIELAIVHARRNAFAVSAGVAVIERGAELPEAFVETLARRWYPSRAAVSTHLVGDELLSILWRAGIPTIPTIHNSREGWRNDPSRWSAGNVPVALACAQSVRKQMVEAGCVCEVVAIRHVPASQRAAVDPAQRARIRSSLGIAPTTLLVGTVGAFKPQKDFPRALEIVAQARALRAAELVILGGVLDETQLAELDRTLARIVELDVQPMVKLPGFVDPIGPYYAACDVLLLASRYEGLSMAAREALAAGLPVVAMDVGGQSEIEHERLKLVPARATAQELGRLLARYPIRERLEAEPPVRAPRIWSLAHAWRRRVGRRVDTVFVSANLNAGGAQRSLVNLAGALPARHRVEVAVCGETTQGAFAETLREAAVHCYRPAPTSDPFAVCESLLARVAENGARTLCFWNADPRVKLLVSKFAPARLRLVDACPGAYAFDEMERERRFAQAITYSVDEFYARLDLLVLKHAATRFPACRDVRVVANGVAIGRSVFKPAARPRFLVSGRIAPSKRLETIVDAFALFCETFPDGELHVVGQAEPRHATYAAGVVERCRGLAVHFRGARPDLAHLDEEFTAAIVLGTHQGCPNAVLEAMAASIPVIANASGGTGELVRAHETGWLLAEETQPAELAEAMSSCVRGAAIAARMAANAHARAANEFSLETMAARYLECFAAAAA